MPLLTTWFVPGTQQLVYLHQQPLDVFSRYISRGPRLKGGGGISLGHVRGEHLEIIEATEPSLWDRRFRFLFERMSYLHRRLAMKRWMESKGLVRYIGGVAYPPPKSSDTVLDRSQRVANSGASST
jgi:hypothetical protein